MAAVRLTKSIRDDLTEKLLTRSFGKKVQELAARCRSFADRVYEDVYRKELERMNALPDGWLGTNSSFNVKFGSEYTPLGFNGTLDGWSWPSKFMMVGLETDLVYRRVLASRFSQCNKVYDALSDFAVEYTSLNNEQSDLIRTIIETQQSVKATLSRVTTVQKLIEVWPEVEEFAKKYLVEGEKKVLLPAVSREHLNTILNLPPEEVA